MARARDPGCGVRDRLFAGMVRGVGTVTDLADLRAIAEAATPGPWVMQKPGDNDLGAGTIFIDTHAYEDGPEPVIAETYPLREADAAYIAAASPSVMLELLDRVEAAEQSVPLDFDRLGVLVRQGMLILQRERGRLSKVTDEDVTRLVRGLVAEQSVPLDVERLALALHGSNIGRKSHVPYCSGPGPHRAHAQKIAAEYARLFPAQPTPTEHRPIKRIRARQAEERCLVDDEFWPCSFVQKQLPQPAGAAAMTHRLIDGYCPICNGGCLVGFGNPTMEHEAHLGDHNGYACGFSGPHCWACNEPWPCRSFLKENAALAASPDPEGPGE
jgi:hypothetical protein